MEDSQTKNPKNSLEVRRFVENQPLWMVLVFLWKSTICWYKRIFAVDLESWTSAPQWIAAPCREWELAKRVVSKQDVALSNIKNHVVFQVHQLKIWFFTKRLKEDKVLQITAIPKKQRFWWQVRPPASVPLKQLPSGVAEAPRELVVSQTSRVAGWKNGPFEDVFPIKNGDIAMLVYQRVIHLYHVYDKMYLIWYNVVCGVYGVCCVVCVVWWVLYDLSCGVSVVGCISDIARSSIEYNVYRIFCNVISQCICKMNNIAYFALWNVYCVMYTLKCILCPVYFYILLQCISHSPYSEPFVLGWHIFRHASFRECT